MYHYQFGVSTRCVFQCATHIIVLSGLYCVLQNILLPTDIIALSAGFGASELIQYATKVITFSVMFGASQKTALQVHSFGYSVSSCTIFTPLSLVQGLLLTVIVRTLLL